jgi:hypothetical protein
MNKPTVLGVALVATIVIGACSATTVPSAASSSSAPAVVTPSVAPPSPAPVAAAPSVAPQSLAPAAAGQPQTIHLIDYPTSGTEVSVGSITGCKDSTCLGDYMVGYDPVVDAVTGKEVGTLAYECFLVDPGSTLYHCPGNTFTLTGRGQIVFAEVIQHEAGDPATTAPITGGTGEFLGATGTVLSKKLSNSGDFVITIIK